MEIDLEADKEKEIGDLSVAIKLAQEMMALQDEIFEDEKVLKVKKEKLFKMESVDLPEAMESAGARQKMAMLDGGFVEIKIFTKASLPSVGAINKQKDEDKKAEMLHQLEQGLAWLRDPDIGGEPLIKNFLMFEFSKGQDNVVGEFVERAEELEIPLIKETTVHPQTLEKFIREKMEAGVIVPKDVFSVFSGRKAVIVKAKKKNQNSLNLPQKEI